MSTFVLKVVIGIIAFVAIIMIVVTFDQKVELSEVGTTLSNVEAELSKTKSSLSEAEHKIDSLTVEVNTLNCYRHKDSFNTDSLIKISEGSLFPQQCYNEENKLGKIYGQVTDAKTGYGVAYTFIKFKETKKCAMTDQDGYYRILNVPVGTYNMEFSSASYKMLVVHNVITDEDLKVEMKPLKL